MAVFWNAGPCSVENTDQRFRGAYCFHNQGRGQQAPLKRRSITTGLHGATSQTTAIFIRIAIRS